MPTPVISRGAEDTFLSAISENLALELITMLQEMAGDAWIGMDTAGKRRARRAVKNASLFIIKGLLMPDPEPGVSYMEEASRAFNIIHADVLTEVIKFKKEIKEAKKRILGGIILGLAKSVI
jgi:hypothetical protein